jgi:PAS domain S-box-containing protein
LAFARGEGLPGTAWARGEPIWERQFGQSTPFTRAPLAAAAGIKSAVAIPVSVGDDVVAVLSFYMLDATVDPRLVDMTAAAVAQLGPLIVQKQAEEAHRVAEAKLGGIVSIALDAIISIDHERRITLFNWGAERIFGYTADEALGQPLDMLLPEVLRGRHAAHIAHFAASAATARRMGERSPIVGMRKNGEVFPAEASISRFRAGGQWTFSVIFRDITDRQRTEDGLRFLAETGALLTDIVRDPTVLQRVAERCVPTLGDVCVIDLVDDGRTTAAAVAAGEAVLADRVRAAREAEPLAWASSLGLGSVCVVPLITQDRVLGAISFAMGPSGRRHDASYQVLADELAVRVALAVDGATLYQQARRAVASRDEVLAVVSHDLRNPLSAITMCIGALREAPGPSPDVASELLETVRESTTLMSRIIQDLLDVASIDAGRLAIERRSQPLQPVVAQVAAMLEAMAVEQQLSLSVELEAGLPEVTIDAGRILQVLANLVHNACKFTKPGGTVRITAIRVPEAVEVRVSDSGAGIAREDLPRVFDRFWHNQQGSTIRSTGLGLAIARGIVEAHGGRIWVESRRGEGSTFAFTLPSFMISAYRQD